MTTFQVMVNGARFAMQVEGDAVPCGFVKNEYVWAASKAEAVEKAKLRVLSKLEDNPAVYLLGDLPISLKPQEVESGIPIWKLLSKKASFFIKSSRKRLEHRQNRSAPNCFLASNYP